MLFNEYVLIPYCNMNDLQKHSSRYTGFSFIYFFNHRILHVYLAGVHAEIMTCQKSLRQCGNFVKDKTGSSNLFAQF